MGLQTAQLAPDGASQKAYFLNLYRRNVHQLQIWKHVSADHLRSFKASELWLNTDHVCEGRVPMV